MVARRSATQRITEEDLAEAERWLNPLPSSVWRWEEAARLAKLKPSERHCDDPDMTAAAEYLAALACCTTGEQRAAVQRRWPSIIRANDIFRRNGPQRWALEAWILHGLADREIADRCGLKPEVVRVYESLFFAMCRIPSQARSPGPENVRLGVQPELPQQ